MVVTGVGAGSGIAKSTNHSPVSNGLGVRHWPGRHMRYVERLCSVVARERRRLHAVRRPRRAVVRRAGRKIPDNPGLPWLSRGRSPYFFMSV